MAEHIDRADGARALDDEQRRLARGLAAARCPELSAPIARLARADARRAEVAALRQAACPPGDAFNAEARASAAAYDAVATLAGARAGLAYAAELQVPLSLVGGGLAFRLPRASAACLDDASRSADTGTSSVSSSTWNASSTEADLQREPDEMARARRMPAAARAATPAATVAAAAAEAAATAAADDPMHRLVVSLDASARARLAAAPGTVARLGARPDVLAEAGVGVRDGSLPRPVGADVRGAGRPALLAFADAGDHAGRPDRVRLEDTLLALYERTRASLRERGPRGDAWDTMRQRGILKALGIGRTTAVKWVKSAKARKAEAVHGAAAASSEASASAAVSTKPCRANRRLVAGDRVHQAADEAADEAAVAAALGRVRKTGGGTVDAALDRMKAAAHAPTRAAYAAAPSEAGGATAASSHAATGRDTPIGVPVSSVALATLQLKAVEGKHAREEEGAASPKRQRTD